MEYYFNFNTCKRKHLGVNESIVKFPVIIYRLYLEINRSK